jgi:hypothetical protein
MPPFHDDVQDVDVHPNVTPGSEPLDVWPTFAELVRRRLEKGRATYGDRSFDSDPTELIGELQQECLDLAGWGFVLFCRLEAMVRALSTDRVQQACAIIQRMTPEERDRFARCRFGVPVEREPVRLVGADRCSP